MIENTADDKSYSVIHFGEVEAMYTNYGAAVRHAVRQLRANEPAQDSDENGYLVWAGDDDEDNTFWSVDYDGQIICIPLAKDNE